MNIYNLSLLFISILHTCNSTIWVTAPGLPSFAVDILPDMTLRDIQQQLHSQQSTSYDGISFGGKEYLFNDTQQLLSDIGIGPESSVEAFKTPSDCYFLTQIFDQTNVYDVLQNWGNVSDIHSNECCLAWEGIKCNQYNKISQIIVDEDLCGTLDLSNLVSISSLRELRLENNALTGTIDLTTLPSTLHLLNLGNNQFTGTTDLTDLPASLQCIMLWGNQFSGTVDLTRLPSTLQLLYLDHNQFTGAPDLTTLPNALDTLWLNHNQFTGTPDLTHLPESLMHLYLNNNQFTGTPDLTRLPASLTYLCLDYNQFTGFVNLTALPSSLDVSIRNTGISTTITTLPLSLNVSISDPG
eukprot:990008_1